jgi:hypothetical protein
MPSYREPNAKPFPNKDIRLQIVRQNLIIKPVTTGSILEAKPLHQGQKTRILGRGSQSCSHLYSAFPVPSQNLPKQRKVAARAMIGYLVGYEGTSIFRIWILYDPT